MKYTLSRPWGLVLCLYLLGGLALGLSDRPFGQAVHQLGVKPGLATAASVNVLLPLLAIGLGVAFPRLATVWLGAVGMTAAFVVGLALVYHAGKAWDAALLLASVPPVLVLACLGYAILGTLAALVSRSVGK